MRQTRFNTLAFSVLLAGSAGLVLLSTPARSQLGVAKGYVNLQSTTPGTAQSGHAHVSGTMRAANFVGSGAGLHSLSGDSIGSGVVSGEFLPDAVAMEDEGNTFTQTNTFDGVSQFNGTAQFNGVSRFMGFTGVGRTSGPVAAESLGIGESAGGYDGIYVKTSGSGRPFYGYRAGTSDAWHDFNNGTWSLTINNSEKLRANANGVGLGTTPPSISSEVLKVVGRSYFSHTSGGPDGVIDTRQFGTGSGIQSIAYGVNGAGVLARTGNPDGYGLYGDATASTTGIGVLGFGWGTQSTGVKALGGSFGLLAETTNGWGVKGTSGASHGVVGISTSVEGVVGLTSTAGRAAVHGYTDVASANGAYFVTVAATGNGLGVHGHSVSPNGYGVYSTGRTAATGTKSFRIDHPLDPENKFLLHYSSEGPEPLNMYSGNIVTGADGFAWVELPDYYSDINRDPRVQLTVDDDSEEFVMAKVVGGVKGNGFRIRTSKPGVKVSWLVLGVRNDAFVRAYGAPVETEKTALERGRYQHPELYGASQDMAIARAKKPVEPAGGTTVHRPIPKK